MSDLTAIPKDQAHRPSNPDPNRGRAKGKFRHIDFDFSGLLRADGQGRQ